MKKLAIGCLVIVVVAGAAVVGIGYYGYRRVKSTVAQFQELGHIPELEQTIRIKTPFEVPKTGELTATQVDHFMQVQTRVRDRIGQNLALFERNYKSLADKKEATVADLPTLLAAYRDMAATWMDAKRTQVQALNDVGLSLDEYRWIRSESYRALDIPFIDVDFARIAEQARSGGPMSAPVLVGGALAGPAAKGNAKLVEKYRKELEAYMPLAAFGL